MSSNAGKFDDDVRAAWLGTIDYGSALELQRSLLDQRKSGEIPDSLLLLEHTQVVTLGRRADDSHLVTNRSGLKSAGIEIFETDRGGEATYHGPGQRIGYVMLNLQRRTPDVRRYVHDLEEWIIRTLASFNVTGERREGRVGIWVDRGGGREDKIAAIGVRIRHWITFHGIAINVEPTLEHFSGIVPCGIGDVNLGVTSLVDLGLPVTTADLDVALMAAFKDVFGT